MNPKKTLLHINHVRKKVGFLTSWLSVRSETMLRVLDTPPAGNILVLAPHPDDETFGCGGTLAQQAKNGSRISVLFLTNGANEGRRAESAEACKTLGINDLMFWDIDDDALVSNSDTVSNLKKILETKKPDLVYCPSFIDPNNDHLETAQLLYNTLEQTLFTGQLFFYEVWQPLFANRLICIDNTIDQKKKAIGSYKSQLSQRGYKSAIIGLNQYRAGMFDVGEYAEAFFACSKELYLNLYQKITR